MTLDAVRVDGVLGPITLALAAGERVALLGPNGIGKTTLLRVMAGLAPAAAGAVVAAAPVGYVAQSYRASLLPWFRVRDNLALGLPGRPARGALAPEVAAALAAVPLARELLDRHPYRLSGGEQQLVALARALVGRPRLLLLDEPFSALDAPTRIRLRRTLGAHLPAEAALVLVSHDLDDALALARRALVLGGRPARLIADLPLPDGGEDGVRAELTRLLGEQP